MHASNNVFWEYVSKKFYPHFNDEIIEYGSYDINGTIRDHLKYYRKYIGVD